MHQCLLTVGRHSCYIAAKLILLRLQYVNFRRSAYTRGLSTADDKLDVPGDVKTGTELVAYILFRVHFPARTRVMANVL